MNETVRISCVETSERARDDCFCRLWLKGGGIEKEFNDYSFIIGKKLPRCGVYIVTQGVDQSIGFRKLERFV